LGPVWDRFLDPPWKTDKILTVFTFTAIDERQSFLPFLTVGFPLVSTLSSSNDRRQHWSRRPLQGRRPGPGYPGGENPASRVTTVMIQDDGSITVAVILELPLVTFGQFTEVFHEQSVQKRRKRCAAQ